MKDDNFQPPGISRWILEKLMRSEDLKHRLGDFEETFCSIARRKGFKKARGWYRKQLFKSMPGLLSNSFYWNCIMFSNYLKTAIRNLIRYKSYSCITIAGLAVGMACTIILVMWIQDELSFDKFHANRDNLYRVIQQQDVSGQIDRIAITQSPLGNALKREFPEILEAARIYNERRKVAVKSGEKKFFENGIYFADPSFLRMFTYEFKEGTQETALSEPFSIVLTESIARKYFGEKNASGRIITIDFFNGYQDFKVTAIMKDAPANSHLQFTMLASFNYFYETIPDYGRWGNFSNYFTYVLLDNNAERETVNRKISNYLKKHLPETKASLVLQPVTDIHLNSDAKFDAENNGNIKNIYIFLLTAFFIFLIACINFMNLTTARAGTRAKEVGIRKVVGANRSNVIKQFFGESIFLTGISLILAIVLVWLSLPVFNGISGKQLMAGQFESSSMVTGLIVILLLTGIVSGSYPALLMSAFKPVRVIKGVFKSSSNGFSLRRILVIVQFCLSVMLIVGMLVVSRQVDYMSSRNPGFDKSHVLHFQLQGKMKERYSLLKNELLRNAAVLNVTAANVLPTHGNESNINDWEGNTSNETIRIHITAVDYDYFETMRIKMVEGRTFSKEFPTDKDGIIINEEAAKQMSMDEPIGKRMGRGGDSEYRIIGVVKNYHFMSFHNRIEPIMLMLTERHFYNALIRIKSENIPETLAFIEDVCREIEPDYPFDYTFFDEDLSSFYKNEGQMGKVINYFALLAIFIACSGLFGLALFTAEQRTKEIGVRKVLGASITKIVNLLTKEYIKWVLIANVIGLPAAYFAMTNWLDNFAYRIDLVDYFWIFILACALSVIIAVVTVMYQSIKAAVVNPIDSLKYE